MTDSISPINCGKNESETKNSTRNESKHTHLESVIKTINANPQGISYSRLRESTDVPGYSSGKRIVDSTLSRVLGYALNHGIIYRNEGKYYPSGADFAVPMFSRVMEIVRNSIDRSGGIKQESVLRLTVALDELLPGSYPYNKLAAMEDLRVLLKVLDALVKGPKETEPLQKFLPWLAQFISRCMEVAKEDPPSEIVRLLGETEILLFNHDSILEKAIKRQKDSITSTSWYFIYNALCRSKTDAPVSDVLNRFIEHAKDLSRPGQEKNSGIAVSEALNNIAASLRNDLWNDVLANLLYHRQIEFFNEQLRYAENPAMSEFFAKLRSFGIEWWKEQREVKGNTDKDVASE